MQLNHTIVNVKDRVESGDFVAEILGLPKPTPLWHFYVLNTANGVSLDFCDSEDEIEPMHYAFLVSDKEFDEIFGRIQKKGITYWADPARRLDGRINTHFGGRGCYFCEPSGHFLEIITRPYKAE